MRKLYTLLSFFFLISFSNAQNPDAFITTWQVTDSDLTIFVPIVFDSGNNYTIDFGDGTALYNQNSLAIHTYSQPGIYTVTLTGNFKRINFDSDSQSALNIIEINQWGTTEWSSMEGAFSYCTNLAIIANDTPNLSSVTSMNNMLAGISYINETISLWDVSNIMEMANLFNFVDNFNQPLNNWNVSNVTIMNGMFSYCNSFNQPLNNWDVSNVNSMSFMFRNAINFNQPLNNWNVSNVTTMYAMFSQADIFNQPLNNWDVSNVNRMDWMFNLAYNFNQPLNNWDVSNVTTMNNMFSGAYDFNQSINNWNVSNVTDMKSMFHNANSFNQQLGNWDVSNVSNMGWMFIYASSFNQPLNNWNVSNVTDMSFMFKEATTFNRPLNNWDVSNVTNMNSMFHLTTQFNQDISSWNFNSDVLLGYNSNNNSGFISNSGLNVINYDRVLNKFAELELQSKQIGAHSLQYCNAGVRNYLIDNLGWTIVGDSVSDDCGTNLISGKITFDENLNGCNLNDTNGNYISVKVYDLFGLNTITFSNGDGEYEFNLNEGNYDVELINLPSYFSATPISSSVTIVGTETNQTVNFCLTATETIEDLAITLLPISEARPGFEADYQLIIQNVGTQTLANATITLTFDNSKQSFVSANPLTSSTSENQLSFSISNIKPFENKRINLTMQTFSPPTVNSDDVLNFTATVTPNTNDYTPNDNTFELNQIVVNAYDPNDKQVLQGDEILIEQVGDYLHYLIRFQNTGTASAINVRIEDVLHESLNWNTLQMVSSSHDFRAEITENNQLAFIFNNINLPHEAADEEGSNGFVAYKIKPIEGLTVGDFITGNEASIFFDFNLPIITNAVETEIVDQLNVNEFNLNTLISIYPNPTNDILNIKVKDDLIVEEVKLINLLGRELLSSKHNLENINLSNLSSGVYLIKLKTNLGTIQSKIIKN